MTDPVTPYASLTKPTVGADNNTWGGISNTNWDLVDAMLRAICPPGEVKSYAGTMAAGPPVGFLFCNGQAVSRTTYASLWAVAQASLAQSEAMFGAGDGSTTFTVPDLRNTFLVGAGSTYTAGASGGATSYTPTLTVASTTLTLAQIPSHNHTATDSGHIHVDAGHGHTLDGSFTGASLSDPGHAHGLGGTGFVVYQAGGAFHQGAPSFGEAIVLNTDAAITGLSFNDPGHGHTLHVASANIQSSTANITVAANGGGGGHTHTATSNAVPTLPPYRAINYIIKT